MNIPSNSVGMWFLSQQLQNISTERKFEIMYDG